MDHEFAHLDNVVERLLGAIGGRTLTAAERERLVDEVPDVLTPLVMAVEFLATHDPSVTLDVDLREPLLRSNEDVTLAGRSWFHVACARGDLNIVTALVERCGLDQNRAEPDLNGQTPLHVAAAQGHLEVVAFLLKCSSVDLVVQDAKGRTPLACAKQHDEVAGFIKWWDPSPSWSLDKGQEEEKTPLTDVPAGSDDLLDDKTASPHDDRKKAQVLDQAFAHLEDLVARLLNVVGERSAWKSGQSRRMLTEAERSALVEEAWTAANDFGDLTPLITAVEFLASASSGTLVDELHEPLLRANKAFAYKDRSWFHVVCARGDLDAARALVKGCGLDPTQAERDINGETPLHTAANNGFLEVVAFLLECGFDQTLEDGLGLTPRECAELHSDVASLFESLAEPSYRVAKQVAEEVAKEMEESAAEASAQVEDPKLPTGTAIKDEHDHLTSSTRFIIDYIARGAFGNVYVVRHPRAQRLEAVKVVRLVDRQGRPLKDAERVERLRSQVDEAEIMLELGLHPNLVAIRGMCLLRTMQDSSGEAVADNLYVFMDYVEGGMTLAGCIKQLDLETKVHMALHIARGLDHIRRCFPNLEFTHWDVKPENILVECARNDEDGTLIPKTAKIGDFGKAMTTAYASHETFTYGFESDLAARTQHEWSWATTFMALLLGERSWDDYNQAVFKLEKELEFVPHLGDNEGNLFLACLRVCERCMHHDPELRCSMKNVVAELSRFLGDVDAVPLQLVERNQLELWDLHTNIGNILYREVTKMSKDYARAEAHLATAKKLATAIEGEKNRLLATLLDNLARLFEAQGKYNQANPLYERDIAIIEKTLGVEDPDLAISLNNLAGSLRAQGKYDEAKPLYERAIAITEKTLGAEHPTLATSLSNLGLLLHAQGYYHEAKQLYERAIAIDEKALGAEHPVLAVRLNNFAGLLQAQGKYDKAKPLYVRAIAINEKTLGAEHPALATSLNNLAELLSAQDKYDEAKPLYERAIAIGEKTLGGEHPVLATSLNNLAELLRAQMVQGNYDEAKTLYEQAIAILEKTLGKEHPDLAKALNNLALVLQAQGCYNEATPLHERAIVLTEKTLGKEHPDLAKGLSNLAVLLARQGSYDEAMALFKRAHSIFQASLGPDHENTKNAASLMQQLKMLATMHATLPS